MTGISAADQALINRLQNIDSMLVMVPLISSSHTEQRGAFPIELVLAICWEETFFQNIPQQGGPAVGYGQLEGSGRRIASQHLTGNPNAGEGVFNRGAILASREVSIQAVSHCLAGLYERLGKNQMAALNGFAGVNQRPANAPIPGRWLACASTLRNLLSAGLMSVNMIAVEDALRKAKTFEKSGPVYEHIHSRLWPIHEILQQLFGQVQIGAQGGQVMIVQDTMNRLQNVDAASGNSFPLLAVDGQFGPKTHARVKEFQG